MIRDHPWLGCGPGNFQDVYTAYKLPTASEEVRDPHDFLLEIAATAGLPALAAMGIVLVLFFLRACRASSAGGAILSGEVDDVILTGTERDDSAHRAGRFIGGGALLGLLLAWIFAPLVDPGYRIERILLIAVAGGVAWLALAVWTRSGACGRSGWLRQSRRSACTTWRPAASVIPVWPDRFGCCWPWARAAQTTKIAASNSSRSICAAGAVGDDLRRHRCVLSDGLCAGFALPSGACRALSPDASPRDRDAAIVDAAAADPLSAEACAMMAESELGKFLAGRGQEHHSRFAAAADAMLHSRLAPALPGGRSGCGIDRRKASRVLGLTRKKRPAICNKP